MFKGCFHPFFFQFTKVKQKSENNNKCRENLRFYNFSLQFYICKSKELEPKYLALELQTQIRMTKALQSYIWADFA